MNEPSRTTKERVLTAIRAGSVAMRPRWQFVLLGALWLTGAILVALTLLFLVSFIFFSLHQSGASVIPTFGLRGLIAFLLSLPWLLILISLLFVGIMEVLVRRYAFAWRRPLLYSLAGVLATVVLASIVVAQTPFHRNFLFRADGDELPFAGPFYRQYGSDEHGDIHKGLVRGIVPDGLTMTGHHQVEYRIHIGPATDVPPEPLQIGDAILVFGPLENGTIDALGIRHIDAGLLWRTPPPGPMPQGR